MANQSAKLGVKTMSKTRVMLDLETLGTEPGAAIVSIGAVTFDLNGVYSDHYHRQIDLESCENYGLKIDVETLKWWFEQPTLSNDELLNGAGLGLALNDFKAWYPDDTIEIWAKSPAFDCGILDEAMQRVGIDKPWDYWETRDVRTIQAISCIDDQVTRDEDLTEHDALDDAIHQAEVVAETLCKINDATGGGNDGD